MSKILELAKEIDNQFHEMNNQILKQNEQIREQDEQIKNLVSHATYLESELNNEKERGAKFRKGLITLLAEYANDDWHSW